MDFCGPTSVNSFSETKGVTMKTTGIFFSLLLVALLLGCSKDTPVSQNNTYTFKEVISDSGYGRVVGYEGYFSPELSPRGYPQPYPSGYVMTNFSWEAGTPASLYRIYLLGRDTDLAKAIRVRASGNWQAVRRTIDTNVTAYITLKIDSLEILE
jgi:hypothetical protein